MNKKSLSSIFFVIVSIFISFVLFAEEKKDKTLAPYFFIKNGDPSVDFLPLKETNVVVNISGVIAEITITQKYTNIGKNPINARYIFPASTRAAVHNMRMIIGEKIIRAEIKKRYEAKKKFENAKRSGKSAALLEQQRPNVFSMNVANILPGDNIDVELSYTEFLVPTENIYEFVFPTVVGPRYSNQPEKTASEYDTWVKNPYFRKEDSDESINEAEKNNKMIFNIKTNVSTGIPIQEITCTTHKTDISWESGNAAKISLDRSEKFSGNRDYIIKYRLAGEKILSGLMLYEGKEENFFMLMVQPPERVELNDIPPREFIFVVDVSGSMHGFPLNTSKKLLRDLIRNLRPEDSFNVILFAGTSSILAEKSIPAVSENIERAISFINRSRGSGGTELLKAIKRAINLPHENNCSRSIVIATDGYVSFEKDIFSYIRKNLNNSNIFAFGIGSSVNRYLIKGIAKAGYGEQFIVTKPKEASVKAAEFRRYIQSPVLTNISVEYRGFNTYQIEPQSIADLLSERPVMIFGKWKDKPEGNISLSGISGNGEYKKTFVVSKTKSLETNRSIKYLWARTKIANLSDYNFSAESKDIKAEITSLGLDNNLLTKYTSFVAVHEEIRNPGGNASDVTQPLPLPKGVSNLAVGGQISRSPEPELHVMLILVLILVVLVSIYKSRVQ